MKLRLATIVLALFAASLLPAATPAVAAVRSPSISNVQAVIFFDSQLTQQRQRVAVNFNVNCPKGWFFLIRYPEARIVQGSTYGIDIFDGPVWSSCDGGRGGMLTDEISGSFVPGKADLYLTGYIIPNEDLASQGPTSWTDFSISKSIRLSDGP